MKDGQAKKTKFDKDISHHNSNNLAPETVSTSPLRLWHFRFVNAMCVCVYNTKPIAQVYFPNDLLKDTSKLMTTGLSYAGRPQLHNMYTKNNKSFIDCI